MKIVQPDTAQVPNSGPTVASRTCMIVGKLVESAALALRQTLVHRGLLAPMTTIRRRISRGLARRTSKRSGRCARTASTTPPPGIHWDDEKYHGDAYGAYAWAVYVAEV